MFVYGSLKRGEGNHHWLVGAVGLGEASLEGVALHDLGPFPMAVAGEGVCHGEVYAVSQATLTRLDALEGHPRLYLRQWRQLVDGRWVWVYLGRARQVRHSPRLAEGRWQGRSPEQPEAARAPEPGAAVVSQPPAPCQPPPGRG